LEGIVPVLMHTPPMTVRRSMMAARWPAGPEPMTIRSKSWPSPVLDWAVISGVVWSSMWGPRF
jgi:hypothetical protein